MGIARLLDEQQPDNMITPASALTEEGYGMMRGAWWRPLGPLTNLQLLIIAASVLGFVSGWPTKTNGGIIENPSKRMMALDFLIS
jgi:hypothetical protein